jgi:stage II sporulation protein D
MYSEEAYDLAYSVASAAVDATDGEVITYGGELCTAVYHASSFGTTESSYNLWGTYTPYLISVTTPEKTEPVSTTIDKISFEKYAYSLGADRFHNINVNKNDSGRCDVVSVGGVRIPASKIRSHFGLKSCDFDVSMNADNIVFTAYGYGHGVGMSQEGANTMAKEGSTYKEIICHYYTGVKIETVI